MQNTHLLVGCIEQLDAIIRTRFFYVNKEENVVKDVTLELCDAIESYNDVAQAIRNTGTYAMMIPYTYKYGMAEYSFGCGLTHYLQEKEFKKVEEAFVQSGNKLSFPLEKCSISMFTPHDVKHLLSCRNVFDIGIQKALHSHYGLESVA